MKRWIAIGTGVIALLWVPFLMMRSKEDREAEPAAPDTEQSPVEGPSQAPSAGSPAPAAARAPDSEEKPAGPGHPAAKPGAKDGPEQAGSSQPPVTTGPIAELKSLYESTPRGAQSGAAEARIRAVFGSGEVPAEMLRGVSCHENVCKVELRWWAGGENAHMIVMMSFVNQFSQKIAWEPVGPADAAGRHPIDVYVTR